MPKRFNFRLSQEEQVYLLQAKLRIQTLEKKFEYKGIITLKQLQETQKEIDDFKRFLKANYKNGEQWLKYFKDEQY